MITYMDENVWDWWLSAVAYQNRVENYMPDEELNERLQREVAADTKSD